MPNELIYITSCDLSCNKDEVMAMIKNDTELVNFLNDFKTKELIPNDIEVFEQIGNMLITENGYYFSFWESDLIKVEE